MRRLALILLVAAPLFAADATVKRWNQRMIDASNALKAQKYAKALDISNNTIHQMLGHLGPGDAATRFFGMAVTHKALAHAGLGQNDEALWYWHTVLALYPQFADSDMSMYGAPGAFLKANLRKAPSYPHVSDNVTAPVVRSRVAPLYPNGAYAFAVSGEMVLEVVITAEGKVTSPTILKAPAAPTLSYCALDAVRRWKFDPATQDGKPVPVIFNLTINFKP